MIENGLCHDIKDLYGSAALQDRSIKENWAKADQSSSCQTWHRT